MSVGDASKMESVERWDLTEGSEMRTSATIRYTGEWVRFEDVVRLLRTRETSAPIVDWKASHELAIKQRDEALAAAAPAALQAMKLRGALQQIATYTTCACSCASCAKRMASEALADDQQQKTEARQITPAVAKEPR